MARIKGVGKVTGEFETQRLLEGDLVAGTSPEIQQHLRALKMAARTGSLTNYLKRALSPQNEIQRSDGLRGAVTEALIWFIGEVESVATGKSKLKQLSTILATLVETYEKPPELAMAVHVALTQDGDYKKLRIYSTQAIFDDGLSAIFSTEGSFPNPLSRAR